MKSTYDESPQQVLALYSYPSYDEHFIIEPIKQYARQSNQSNSIYKI